MIRSFRSRATEDLFHDRDVPRLRAIERLRRVPDSARSVMVIGHNPGMHDLALRLAAGGDRLPQLAAKFPTAALATLELGSQRWSECDQDARLADYVVPRELG